MLHYHLISRTAKLGKNKDKTVYQAQALTLGTVPYEDFCREVADGSTVDVADVKAVLSRLHTVISRNISRGFAVEVGELGNFRPIFGSVEVLDKAIFEPKLHIKRPHIVFTPRVSFRDSIRSVGFEYTELTPRAARAKATKPDTSAPAESEHSDKAHKESL